MRSIILAAAASLAASGAAAAPAVGLTGANTLVLFDTDAPAQARTVRIASNAVVAGVDMRPSTGELIAVTTDGAILTVDPETGAVLRAVAIMGPMPAGDGPFVVDFNPAADKLRLMRGAVNHRIDPDTGALTVDGALAYVAEDARADRTPRIVAAAYTNSRGRPDATAMYDIDAVNGALVRQIRPNDGALQSVGALGVSVEGATAFDVATDAQGVNTAVMASGGALHVVDLATGRAVRTGSLPAAGPLRDIAILPAE